MEERTKKSLQKQTGRYQLRTIVDKSETLIW